MITGDIPQPKILLEGTHLTRKTDVAFALAEHVDIVGHRKRRWHIPLISAEWETRSDKQPTKSKPGRSMIDFQQDDWHWVEDSYETYLRMLELHKDYYWIIDRFHISTIVHQKQQGRIIDLDWVDNRLSALGFVLVHLKRRPSTFGEARRERLRYSENPDRYHRLEAFISEQELVTGLVAKSSMRSISVDVSDGNVQRIAQEIVDWIKKAGLFYRRHNASAPEICPLPVTPNG